MLATEKIVKSFEDFEFKPLLTSFLSALRRLLKPIELAPGLGSMRSCHELLQLPQVSGLRPMRFRRRTLNFDLGLARSSGTVLLILDVFGFLVGDGGGSHDGMWVTRLRKFKCGEGGAVHGRSTVIQEFKTTRAQDAREWGERKKEE